MGDRWGPLLVSDKWEIDGDPLLVSDKWEIDGGLLLVSDKWEIDGQVMNLIYLCSETHFFDHIAATISLFFLFQSPYHVELLL